MKIKTNKRNNDYFEREAIGYVLRSKINKLNKNQKISFECTNSMKFEITNRIQTVK